MTNLCNKSLLKDIKLHKQCGFSSRGVWTCINLQDRDDFGPSIVAQTSHVTSTVALWIINDRFYLQVQILKN